MVSNLSKSANEALLQHEYQSEDEPDEECDAASNNDDDDDDDDSLQEMELAPETNLEFVLNNLNEEVIKLNPPSPPRNEKPTIPPPRVVKVRKPPHCLKCSHAKLGHDRISSILSRCPLCLSQVCSETLPQTPCTCTWHTSNS